MYLDNNKVATIGVDVFDSLPELILPCVVAKLAWPGLEARFPDAYEFLSRFRMTNEQQNEIVLSAAQNGLTVRQAAQHWVDENESVWRTWIQR